jgi:Domain of unknown function (DUF5666)
MVDDMRYTLLVLAAMAALSVAACGSSSNPTPAASGTSSSQTSPSSNPTSAPSGPASTPPSQPGNGHDHVAGLIATVSGNSIQVTQQNGTATVDFSDSTPVSEIDPAQLSDVTTGSCVAVRPTHDGGAAGSGSITARAVLINPASNGSCSQPQGGPGGPGRPGGRGAQPIRGTVASVNGNTVALTTAGNPSQLNVSVTNTTTYSKHTDSNSQAIAQGKCIAARGTKDSSGALQATAINLQPANNGSCPGPRR